jgi:hypothetical protein
VGKPLYIVGGIVKWYNHFVKYFANFLKVEHNQIHRHSRLLDARGWGRIGVIV